MFSVFTCVTDRHDLKLVMLSVSICMVASLAAFAFQVRGRSSAGGMRHIWLGLAGLLAGSGAWAMHFIAMLAYQPDLRIGYEPIETVLSLLFVVFGATVGFAAPVFRPGARGLFAGGVFAGLGVAAMHYIGIAAIRTQAHVSMDAHYVVASVVAGVAMSVTAFWFRDSVKGWLGWVGAAGFLVLAICGLHFTAMTAIRIMPDPRLADPAVVVGRDGLVIATALLSLLILAGALSLRAIERLSRSLTLKDMQSALDAVSAGMLFMDADDRVSAANEALVKLFADYGVSIVPGMHSREILDALGEAGWFGEQGQPDRFLTDTRAWQSSGVEFRLPDGRWMRHEAFHTRNGSGVALLTDVSAERAASKALQQARDTAEAASRAKTEFLANMSHEIRTPLNGVLAVAEVLEQTELTSKQQDLVGVIQNSARLLNVLLGDLLDLARVEAGGVDLRPEPTDVGALVASVHDLFAAAAEQKNLQVKARIAPEAEGWVSCDPVRLRQVLGNLVSNGLKFTDAGQVTITVERAGDRLTFRVADTGVGFKDGLKATLFKRFHQMDNSSTRAYGGAGLGLSICQKYVALMGGDLDCASKPGEGSIFMFTLDLPRIEPPLGDATESGGPVGPMRVLIVDDNGINRQVLGLILDTVGIDHAEAENGKAGLEAATRAGFDAILMDMQMPVMDGLEATRNIRAWEAETGRARTPIFIVSANGLPEHVAAGLEAGADGHLSKPVSVAQLLGALQPLAETARLAA